MYPKSGQSYVYGIRPRKHFKLPRWVGLGVLLMIAGLFFSSSTQSQLQQSGGGGSNASVSSTGGTAPTSATLAGGSYNSSLPSLSTGQMGAVQLDSSAREIIVGAGTAGTSTGGVVSVQGVGGGTALPVSGTVTINAIPSSTNLIGYTRAQNGCGTTNYESVMTNPPTASTSLTATTTCVAMIYVSNTTASAATLTIQDQGTNCNTAACIWIDAFSVPANSNMVIPLYGAKMTGGIKWNQGTANALSADVLGNQ